MEKEITVKKHVKTEEFTFGAGKKGYNIFVETEEGELKLTTFSETIKGDIDSMGFLPETFKVKYTEKENDKGYTNRTITAVADTDGNYKEAPKTFGGGARGAFKDTKSIQRQVALKCATELGVASKHDPEVIVANAHIFNTFLMEE